MQSNPNRFDSYPPVTDFSVSSFFKSSNFCVVIQTMGITIFEQPALFFVIYFCFCLIFGIRIRLQPWNSNQTAFFDGRSLRGCAIFQKNITSQVTEVNEYE